MLQKIKYLLIALGSIVGFYYFVKLALWLSAVTLKAVVAGFIGLFWLGILAFIGVGIYFYFKNSKTTY